MTGHSSYQEWNLITKILKMLIWTIYPLNLIVATILEIFLKISTIYTSDLSLTMN